MKIIKDDIIKTILFLIVKDVSNNVILYLHSYIQQLMNREREAWTGEPVWRNQTSWMAIKTGFVILTSPVQNKAVSEKREINGFYAFRISTLYNVRIS